MWSQNFLQKDSTRHACNLNVGSTEIASRRRRQVKFVFMIVPKVERLEGVAVETVPAELEANDETRPKVPFEIHSLCKLDETIASTASLRLSCRAEAG
jgi:hypothetical protein